MLKLKRVEIQGFKSFYDRTEMKFPGSGIAAIVGPNGCGKSNLSDAISWVLGEQSAKTLRGSRMEDVIFAGTREKKPLGMAAVTMTLVPDERAGGSPAAASDAAPVPNHANGHGSRNGAVEHPPIKTDAEKAAERSGEITITRRLYRSGESEYLINGKLARLRDIQDLFFGTGLGPESYAIIEQGRIGQILSNKPQDRRAVIEEAAGITKFKTRKRLAEAKLESAKQNLARVFDILEEVTRQVNSLKRQASKARRYGELKAEATSHLRRLLAAKFRMLERETAKIAIELNLASAEFEKAQTAIGRREAEQAGVVEQLYANDRELTAARKRLADWHVEAERARGRLEYQSKQIEQIDERVKTAEQEARTLEGEQQVRTAELETQAAGLARLEDECAAAREELEEKSAARQESQNRLSEEERQLERARQRVLELWGKSAELKNRMTQCTAQLAAADREAQRAHTEEQQSEEDRKRIAEESAAILTRLAARQNELTVVSGRRREIEQELDRKRVELGGARERLERVRTEFSRVKARKDSLEEVLQHHSYTTETVKRLFTAAGTGQPQQLEPVGVLADFLEVESQFEKAAEEFLHDELEYVVVRDWADAERGIELMRTELNGRATFLVEAAPAMHAPGELPELAAEPGIVAKLTDTLRFTNGLANIPIYMLPRIANCYIVNERGLARDLAAQFPHCWFLTADGVNYHGRAVSGGKKTGAGPLAMKRELREMSQLEATKQSELSRAQSDTGELERVIAELVEKLEHLRAEQQTQEKDALALDHESRRLAEEEQRTRARLAHARLELERVARERLEMEQNRERDQQAMAEAEQARAEEEEALEKRRAELTGVQQELARRGEEHATLRAQLASLEERRRSLAAQRSRLQTELEDFTNRRAHLDQERARWITERSDLLANNSELESKTAELAAAIHATQADVNGLAEREAELRSRVANGEEELKGLRAETQAAQEKRSALQVSLARGESDLGHLEETCQKELDATLAQLAEGTETIADEAALAELDGQYMEVRRRIEALGPVNPQAVEEYEEAEQRQEFLNTQRQDLLDSIRDTEKAIHEIDHESRRRFSEAFRAINENFREMFRVLFGGGIGEMRLTDEENVAESGVDIVASPPGKRLQSVLLLSGGEKSLTAMALLMAVFQYTPSPFCVLDEVDAPLDEPNIERLTKLLREMAGQTQFIVITHAKRTMEAAQSLYGVTMQEPGVSKLVSVKFGGVTGARASGGDRQESRGERLETATA